MVAKLSDLLNHYADLPSAEIVNGSADTKVSSEIASIYALTADTGIRLLRPILIELNRFDLNNS